MKSFLFIAALSTMLVSCQNNTSTITGTLLGANGNPMPLAHVHLAGATRSPLEGNDLDDPVLITRKVRDDGTFAITTTHTGAFILLCTGVGHSPLRIPLPLETYTDLSVNIRLACPLPDTSQAEIEILTSVDGGATRQRNYLAKQVDGSFQADISTIGDSLWYKIYASSQDSWGTTSIGGTAQRYELISQAKYAETISEPEYVAVVPITDGHARIEYHVPSETVHRKGAAASMTHHLPSLCLQKG